MDMMTTPERGTYLTVPENTVRHYAVTPLRLTPPETQP